MTIAWTSYEKYVAPYVPGAASVLIRNAIREAAVELCEFSQIWREELTAIDSVVGQDEYTLTPITANTRVVLPIEARYNERPLQPKSEEELDEIDYGWRTTENGKPSYYFCPDPDSIRFNRKSDTVITGGIVVKVALKPTEDSTGADDLLFKDWYRVIADGAISKLRELPGKQWSDLNDALMKSQQFSAGKTRARSRAKRGHTNADRRVRMRRFV